MNRNLLLAAIVLLASACGHKIGDACGQNVDCSTDGTRICDTSSLPGGYCTIQGCDFGSCPDEAVCVRFFPSLESTATCKTQGDCAYDEVCTAAGQCALHSIEQRFCMLTCSSQDDCRDGYECRAPGAHGEPVPDPNSANPAPPSTKFCATRRTCTFNTDCDVAVEVCDPQNKVCVPK